MKQEISNGSNLYLMSCAVSRLLITKMPTHHSQTGSKKTDPVKSIYSTFIVQAASEQT